MIEKFEDLFEGLDSPEMLEKIKQSAKADARKLVNEHIQKNIQEKLGINLDGLKQSLSDYVVANADELATQFVNISPHGDWSKMIEDTPKMAEFLRTEGHKSENWNFVSLSEQDVSKDNNLLAFRFENKSVDEGDVFKGLVLVSFQGKIKHAFAHGDDN